MAMCRGDVAPVKALVLRAHDEFGERYPLQFGHVLDAVKRGQRRMVRYLFTALGMNGNDSEAYGCPPLEDRDESVRTSSPTALRTAINSWHPDMVRFIVGELGTDPRGRHPQDGLNALEYAAVNGCRDTVRLLIGEFGMDPKETDGLGEVLLHKAVEWKQYGVVELLCTVFKDLIDPNSRTSMNWAFEISKPEEPIIHTALLNGMQDAVWLLLGCGADPNDQNECGETLLHYAAADGRDMMIPNLVDAGCKLSTKSWFGESPLEYAGERGTKAVLTGLLMQSKRRRRDKEESCVGARSVRCADAHLGE